MRGETVAIRSAVELLLMPSMIRVHLQRPLPPDIDVLLRIAAGDAPTIASAAAALERPETMIVQAATFFIEQILLAPASDSYRVLGGSRESSQADLHRHMVLLLKWLHPDMDSDRDRAVYVHRVTRAWDDLKTPDRRARYDAAHRHGPGASNGAAGARPRISRTRLAQMRQAALLMSGAQDSAPGRIRDVLARLFGRGWRS